MKKLWIIGANGAPVLAIEACEVIVFKPYGSEFDGLKFIDENHQTIATYYLDTHSYKID